MAISQLNLANLASTLFQDTANGAAVVGVKTSSATIYFLELDNSANAAATFVKFWNATTGSVTLGTTDPDGVIRVPASTKLSIPIPAGWVFNTALSVASVTAGGTGGTGAPVTPITVKISYS